MTSTDIFRKTLRLARKAGARNEIPIAAILVKDGKIISQAFNQTEKKSSFLAHAEILCIQQACKKLKTKYLIGCSLYITLEPCRMCEAAAKLSRIESIHYLLPSKKFGRGGPAYKQLSRHSHRGALRAESAQVLADFFKERR